SMIGQLNNNHLFADLQLISQMTITWFTLPSVLSGDRGHRRGTHQQFEDYGTQTSEEMGTKTASTRSRCSTIGHLAAGTGVTSRFQNFGYGWGGKSAWGVG